ncbi:hypothetical protein BCEP4_2080007 [Burkholderia cepacia]|nr:hypothetical protein BCEP4_2080007 [Burkholderia cepacia]
MGVHRHARRRLAHRGRRLRPVRIPRRADRRQACVPQGTAEAAGLSAPPGATVPTRIFETNHFISFHISPQQME